MNKRRIGTLSFVLFMSITPVFCQKISAFKPDFNAPENIQGYTLVWHDEFNVDGKPDPNNWVYEKGFVRNRELQWYQPENANCKNGVLTIEGRQEKVKNPGYQKDSKDWRRSRKFAHYTSSAIETKGKQQFHFGRIIVRAKIDTSMGAWPAIWTLGVKGRWPLNGEVDIMEYYIKWGKPSILANTNWGTWNTRVYPLAGFTAKDKDWVNRFHIWRMDWTKDFIKIYLDGELMNKTMLSNTTNPKSVKGNPFLQPQYLLLNLAIGSSGGDPSHTKFPIKYEVDYVRYYKPIKNEK